MTWHARLTATAGITYLLLTFTGLAIAPMKDLGGSADVSQYLGTLNSTATLAGGYLQLLAYTALLVFIVQLTADGGTSLSRIAVAGITFALADVTAGMAILGALALNHTAIAPDNAAVLLDMASLLTWSSTTGISLGLGAAGWTTLTTGALPRWMCWAAITTAVALAGTPLLAATPLAHIPATVADLWILVTALILLVQPHNPQPRTPRTQRSTPAAATPAHQPKAAHQ